MENKRNIAELLKDCPQGMELDCTMFEDCTFLDVDEKANTYVIRITTPCGIKYLDEYGCYVADYKAKCVIYPKGKTTWEGFVPPCDFKDGDIVFSGNDLISIFKRLSPSKSLHSYVSMRYNGSVYADGDCWTSHNMRLATEEEKEKLFQAIKDNGYWWNAETKTLESLVEPKFKVGDCFRLLTRDNDVVYTVIKITDTHYIVICDGKRVYEYRIPISKQDDYEKICLKFDYNTLVPFESKVLIRNDKEQKWIPSFGGYKTDTGYITTFGWCRYCIPYEGNEHLLGTTNDCEEFYKTWENEGIHNCKL